MIKKASSQKLFLDNRKLILLVDKQLCCEFIKIKLILILFIMIFMKHINFLI